MMFFVKNTERSRHENHNVPHSILRLQQPVKPENHPGLPGPLPGHFRPARRQPGIAGLAHGEWARLLSVSTRGRRSGYSSEQLLRALLVMVLEDTDLRGTVVLVENSEFLQTFVRLGPQSVMDFTFLDRALNALSPRAWEALNLLLAGHAVREGKIGPEKVRVDSTVYETNIHYPTDSALLWDSFRTVARLVRQLQQAAPELGLRHRFHDRKVKKLFTFIARNGGSKSKSTQRRVKTHYRHLLFAVRWIAGVGQEVLAHSGQTGWLLSNLVVVGLREELDHYLPLVARVIFQAEERILQGRTVPPDEKLYSIFEEHTEMLLRGKAGKPLEFGHMIVLAQTGEKFIHHYRVLERRQADPELLPGALATHRLLFDRDPDLLTTDKGFYQSREQLAELRAKIPQVSIAKKGRRTAAETARETSEAFMAGQRFRAGIEGSISVLKRAFKLRRCLFKGFKHYAASVGLAVLCHNLVLLARLWTKT